MIRRPLSIKPEASFQRRHDDDVADYKQTYRLDDLCPRHSNPRRSLSRLKPKNQPHSHTLPRLSSRHARHLGSSLRQLWTATHLSDYLVNLRFELYCNGTMSNRRLLATDAYASGTSELLSVFEFELLEQTTTDCESLPVYRWICCHCYGRRGDWRHRFAGGKGQVPGTL